MPLGSESNSVQRPFLRYAVEAGWTYLSPDEALNLRHGGITSPVLDAVLLGQLAKLNPGIVNAARAQDIVRRFGRVRPSIEGNLDAWEFLKGLKTVFVDTEKRERNVCLLDPSNVDANLFHVTHEFTFSNGTPPDIRLDIAFFINGVPVLPVETKKATAMDGIAQALDDLRYYRKKGPELLALSQLHVLTHLIRFYYGATWNLSAKPLFNWRDEAVAAGDFESLCKTFIAPRRVLRLLTNFILFTRKDDESSKVVLRPHQMRGAERCVGRARDKRKKRGLIVSMIHKFDGMPADINTRESIQDGTTVSLHYALAPNELRVDRETLEREFLGLASAEGVSDIEDLNKILERAVTLRNMLKNRDRVAKVAAYVAQHFRENVEPMGYKALIDAGVDVVVEVAAKLMKRLPRASPCEPPRPTTGSRWRRRSHGTFSSRKWRLGPSVSRWRRSKSTFAR